MYIKQFYIYVVLALVVLVFSVASWTRSPCLSEGTSSVRQYHQPAAQRRAHHNRERRLHPADDLRLHRPVRWQRHELKRCSFCPDDPERVRLLPALVVTLILGIVMGVLNGFLVMKLRITPVIATLVTLSLLRYCAADRTGRAVGHQGSAERPMPAWINDYARKDVLFGLPWPSTWRVRDRRAGHRSEKDDSGQICRGHRRQPHRSGAVGHQCGHDRVAPLHHRGIFAALAGMARASYMSLGDPLSGDGMETACIIAVLLAGRPFRAAKARWPRQSSALSSSSV